MKRERKTGFGTSDVAANAPSVANSALAVVAPIAPPTVSPGLLFLTTLLLIADLANAGSANRISDRESLRVSDRLANINVLATPVVVPPSGPTSVELDFTFLPDAISYEPPLLIRTQEDANTNIVSGELKATVHGTNSFFMPITTLDLDGSVAITITVKSMSSAGANCVFFIANSDAPGYVTPLAVTASFTGYQFHFSGGRLYLSRYVAGAGTTLDNPIIASPTGHDMKATIVVTGSSVEFEFFKDDVSFYTYSDSNAARVTAFRTSGFGMRNAWGWATKIAGFEVIKG